MSIKEVFNCPRDHLSISNQSVRDWAPANLIHVVRITPVAPESDFEPFEETLEERLEYLDKDIRSLMEELAELRHPYERQQRAEVGEMLRGRADERREILSQLYPKPKKTPYQEPGPDYSDWMKWARSKKKALVFRVSVAEPVKQDPTDHKRPRKKLKKPAFFLRMAFWRISLAFRIFRKH